MNSSTTHNDSNDDGEILAKLDRPRFGDPRDAPAAEQLWVTMREFKGRKFVDVRLRFRGERGDYLPTKKGCTIRARELEAVIVALQAAQDELGGSSRADGGADRGGQHAAPDLQDPMAGDEPWQPDAADCGLAGDWGPP